MTSFETSREIQLSTEVSVCNLYVHTQLRESTRLLQRVCVAGSVSNDCATLSLSLVQVSEAVRSLHLSQVWAQVLQPLLLQIRGERC